MKRKRYSMGFKAKVAVEAIKGQKTGNEIAAKHGVHPNQITQWKKEAMEGLPDLFSTRRKKAREEEAVLRDRLYQEIGRLQVELEWLKKKV
jgi:transposase-like protein